MSEYLSLENYIQNLDTTEFIQWYNKVAKLSQWLKSKSVPQCNDCVNTAITLKNELAELSKSFKRITKNKVFISAAKRDKNNKVINLNIQLYLKKELYKTYKKRFDFDEEKFGKALEYEVYLLLLVNGCIYKGQIEMVAMILLSKYFEMYTKTFDNRDWEWNYLWSQLEYWVRTILETDFNKFLTTHENLKNNIILSMSQHNRDHDMVRNLGKRPLQVEHLTDLWKDEEQLKQSAKVALIMDHYDCERTTAVRWMKQFNLWVRPVAEKNRMKEQPETLSLQNEIKIWKAKYLDMETRYNELKLELDKLKKNK